MRFCVLGSAYSKIFIEKFPKAEIMVVDRRKIINFVGFNEPRWCYVYFHLLVKWTKFKEITYIYVRISTLAIRLVLNLPLQKRLKLYNGKVKLTACLPELFFPFLNWWGCMGSHIDQFYVYSPDVTHMLCGHNILLV